MGTGSVLGQCSFDPELSGNIVLNILWIFSTGVSYPVLFRYFMGSAIIICQAVCLAYSSNGFTNLLMLKLGSGASSFDSP